MCLGFACPSSSCVWPELCALCKICGLSVVFVYDMVKRTRSINRIDNDSTLIIFCIRRDNVGLRLSCWFFIVVEWNRIIWIWSSLVCGPINFDMWELFIVPLVRCGVLSRAHWITVRFLWGFFLSRLKNFDEILTMRFFGSRERDLSDNVIKSSFFLLFIYLLCIALLTARTLFFKENWYFIVTQPNRSCC